MMFHSYFIMLNPDYRKHIVYICFSIVKHMTNILFVDYIFALLSLQSLHIVRVIYITTRHTCKVKGQSA